MVRVLIADDSDVIRHGLRALLSASDAVELVGEARDGEEALALAAALDPDVVLLDVRMPRRDGVAVAAELSSRARVLMLTFSDEPATIQEALRAGATGYLVHGQFDADDLVDAVVSAAGGTGTFSPSAVSVLRASIGAAPAAAERDHFGLTEREREIMDLVAEGLRNGEIAGRCFVAEKTVKNHLNRIFAKLGVESRPQAMALWLNGTRAPA